MAGCERVSGGMKFVELLLDKERDMRDEYRILVRERDELPGWKGEKKWDISF